MSNLFIFTLGFSTSQAFSRFRASSSGDGFLCFAPKPAISSVTRAYDDLKAYASKLGIADMGLVEVDLSDIGGAAYEMARISLEKAGGRTLVFELGGGMRAIVVAALIAAMALSRVASVVVYVKLENNEKEVKIEGRELASLFSPLTEGEMAMLSAIERRPGIREWELAAELGVAEKTVINRLSGLSKRGLLARRGRDGGAYLTAWGRLALLTHGGTSGGASSSGT